MSIEEKIVEIFASCAECPKEEINIDTETESLGLSSFSFIQIIVAIEETYQIEFSMDDLRVEKFISIQNCADRVKELMCGR